MPRDARRAVLLAGVLVALAVLGAALAGPLELRSRPGALISIPVDLPTREVPTPRPRPTAVELTDATTDMPPWLSALVLVVLLSIIAFVGAKAARRVRQWLEDQRVPAVDDDAPPGDLLGDVADLARPALSAGLDHAVLELDRDVPPSDAVVAAWIALEGSAERSGLVRDPAQTASEFTLDLLDATEADGAASRELLGLYLAARFSEHPLEAADVARARRALEVIGRGVRRLRHEVSAEPGGTTSDEAAPAAVHEDHAPGAGPRGSS
ncbi:DUF4129 domain-containing protein [Cellulomonas sp. DKR-3]|uniref:DUF4129 domain-containing protein n=1 Tax=Cellulomonas fulva TaxID=2835530 RepID=A0ABS5TWT2_9CELL|nr:DUF4129 domain-containing protein [Cellulomonas fulva]MBT0993618.1 DUF4129 domain-containing protein [Cellulomonas fulva]